jgi:hypothetical protein
MMSALSAIFLSLALALASVTMATARAQSASVTGQITICSGYGVVSVAVDADGNPVGRVHPCPDCLAGLHLAPAPVLAGAALPQARVSRLGLPRPFILAERERPLPRSRGPPLSA